MRIGFFIASKKIAKKEGIHMRITQSHTNHEKRGNDGILCAFAQLALAVGLFWALKAHLV